ncbi:hypothetical protein CBS147343_6026 [Aspergillus niger]|nr:hypothetical protein CBS133816_4084 [Aspergillus niger]KAI2848835.1 hypothetical protein CBS12448_9026 [Aspergillus niger]KAI2908771.1 hypothetical protein CBS147371_9805 [Aspergillus niger]KAI2924243.1 hypothetical protein CBS147320_6703 [Aspergillus niger]KAI2940056.1 hypothetical protein CBS147321_6387 [Aspergillus niger]
MTSLPSAGLRLSPTGLDLPQPSNVYQVTARSYTAARGGPPPTSPTVSPSPLFVLLFSLLSLLLFLLLFFFLSILQQPHPIQPLQLQSPPFCCPLRPGHRFLRLTCEIPHRRAQTQARFQLI